MQGLEAMWPTSSVPVRHGVGRPEDRKLMEKIPMTDAGYSTLENELKHRQQVERPRIIQQITDARTHGDLSENAEYHAAKEQQSHQRRPHRRA